MGPEQGVSGDKNPQTEMSTRNLVLAIVVLHVVLAAGYARVTPYRAAGVVLTQNGAHALDIGAPDERQHVNYVARLRAGDGLPVFDPRDPHLYESYQSHQPPLFYALAALYSKAVGADDLVDPGSGFRLRLLNALIGGLGVLGVWYLATWGLRNEAVALGATAIAGFLPMNVALSGAVSNDPLLICLCTWCLACCAKGLRGGWNLKLAAAIGVLAGLALLTKTTAVALLPAAGLSFLLASPTDGSGAGSKRIRLFCADRAAIGRCAVGLGVALVFALPWWIRNQSLYGDPLAIKAFNQAFTGSMQAATMMERLGGAWSYWTHGVGYGTMCSFFGVFGYWDVWLDENVYWAFAACALVLTVAWAVSLRGRREDRLYHAVCGLFGLLVLGSFVRFNMQYFQAQGRYLLPALGPIAVGLAGGLAFLARKWTTVAALCVAALLFLLNAYILRNLPAEFAIRLSPSAEHATHNSGDGHSD
jgi:4-amino-4-deoxy-L-arabinose transferase-like glycosyltransferase